MYLKVTLSSTSVGTHCGCWRAAHGTSFAAALRMAQKTWTDQLARHGGTGAREHTCTPLLNACEACTTSASCAAVLLPTVAFRHANDDQCDQ